jgi:purine-binding chemotaxis protein CheW
MADSAGAALRERLPVLAAGGSAARLQSLLVFHVAQQAYALPLNEIREIVPMAELSRPPGAPSILAGFLNVAGRAIPVIHVSRLLSLPDVASTLYTPIVLLRGGNPALALWVERVSQIVRVAENSITPLAANHSFNDCAVGVLQQGDGVVVVLSAERILLDKERQCLAELEAREQQRLQEQAGAEL